MMSPPPYSELEPRLIWTQQYRMAQMTMIIKGYRSAGQTFKGRRCRPIPKVNLAYHKRMMTTPGLLRNLYLTFQTVGPLTSCRDCTESPQDFSFNTVTVSEKPSSPFKNVTASPRDIVSPDLETAIEFVLALEHPCMAHIPYPAEPGGIDPANHMMLVCAS